MFAYIITERANAILVDSKMSKLLQVLLGLSMLLSLCLAIRLNKATALRKEVCTKEAEYGDCHGGQTKWYYDFVKDDCVQFTYSSCGGNRNRFNSRGGCTDFCMDPSTKYYMQDFENV
ncbi:kunitz-type protease inhibitor 3-like [Drosophila busckii]|uniref:kunitz-type protease inhibitor 3-like n=1 Tax=Drosophila busckii TaxID=30019 RepID=UPI00083ECBC5|nr:kunitz-type protease inhibitor 3-like [Drosophila busckii]